jgi:hypothetical protein
VGELSAQDAVVADVAAVGTVIATTPSSNMALEAVLSLGACILSGTVGTATSGVSAFNIGEENTGGTEGVDGTPTDAEVIAEFTLGTAGPTGVMSAAMAAAVSNMDAAADYNVAGQPEAIVSLLDLSSVVSDVQEHLTAVNIGGNLSTLLTNHDTNGRSLSSSSTATDPTFANMIAASSSASTVGAATGIVSVVSICKVL